MHEFFHTVDHDDTLRELAKYLPDDFAGNPSNYLHEFMPLLATVHGRRVLTRLVYLAELFDRK